MTKQETIEAAVRYAIENSCDLPSWANTIAIRYDSRKPAVGDELQASLDNYGRDDVRDFPTYDEELPRLPGTSCYHVGNIWCEEDDIDLSLLERVINGRDEATWKHCSIVIGWAVQNYNPEDEGEVILENCEVVKVLW